MATGFAKKTERTLRNTPGSEEGSRPYRLTVTQYEAMIGSGIFAEGERVELLGGALIQKMAKHEPHNFGVGSTADHLRASLPSGWTVREEKSIVLDNLSRPEPDIVVTRTPREAHRQRPPTTKDIALIVEISDTSYDVDRGAKWVRYAAAKVPVYTILNLPAQRLELYRKPFGRGETARYRETETYEETACLPVVLDDRELGRIAVKDLLA